MGWSTITQRIIARYTTTSNPYTQKLLLANPSIISDDYLLTTHLEWVRKLDHIERLYVAASRLKKLDLSPLNRCSWLTHLDVSENFLTEIDLSPLKNCSRLETLDLSHNKLRSLDLEPLRHCSRLRYLYLQDNSLKKVNIAPLYDLRNLEKVVVATTNTRYPTPLVSISPDNPPPNLNDVIYSLSFRNNRPPWLEGMKSVDTIKMRWQPYSKLVAKHGWKVVRDHLLAAWIKAPKEQDFHAQQIFLKNLGLSELACYDGSISDILELVPTSGSYLDGIETIRSGLISLLTEQLELGGSTLFFDIDKLSTTAGVVLVPLILEQREKELRKLVLYQYNERVNLMPMWMTGFGFNILRAVGGHDVVLTDAIPELLERPAKVLGIEIPIKKTTSQRKYQALGCTRSRPLLDHVSKLVPTFQRF